MSCSFALALTLALILILIDEGDILPKRKVHTVVAIVAEWYA